MAVKIIDVKQVKGNFYGGLPYRVSWSFGGESEPSKLTVDVVNEKGQYQKANLSFLNTETVTIGKFKFEGFLVSYSLNTTPEQKTLTLEYVDKSVLLDKFWVGLHKQHGDKNSPWPNTIILGKQYHPCDVNMDSMVDYTEKNIRLIDPCDPCPYSPVDKYDEACDPRNELVENYETYYTFSELINKIKRAIPDLSIDFDASNLYMYKAQHIGDLRSVLSSWCSDLGLSFFWDPVSNKFIFKPRNSFSQKPIKYDDIIAIPEALEINYSENILDTFSQGFIGSYERPGGLEKYPCQENTWKMLRPLTLEDFFLPLQKPVASKYNEDLSPRSVAVALSYYSSVLRDSFLWFNYYGIETAQDAELYTSSTSSSNSTSPAPNTPTPSTQSPQPGITRVPIQGNSANSAGGIKGNQYVATINSIPPSNFTYNTKGSDNCGSINTLNPSSNSVGDPNILTFFGNMIIKKVYAQNSDDPESRGVFQQLKGLMTTELKEFYDQFTIGQNPGYYFFIAEVSEDGYDEAVNVDRSLATQVLGKYYFNKFRTIVTGASDDESECEVGTPGEDASGQWYKAKQGTENMEIFKFGHDEGSLIDTLKKSIVEDITENQKTDQQRLGKQGLNKDPEDYVANSFILVNRSGPKWSPEKEYADKWFGTFYAWWGEQLYRKFKDSNGRPDILFELFPEANFNENIKLFIVKEAPKGFNVTISTKNHPIEKKGGSKTRIEEDQYGQQFSINEGPWGLLSTDCYEINIDDRMPIFTPPGSFVEELNSYQDECETAPSYSLLNDELYSPVSTSYDGPGYRTFVSCSSEFPKLKNKFSHIFALEALKTNMARKVTYINYQLSEENVAIFGDSCIPNKNQIDAYLRDLGSTSQYNYSDPFFQINFKLADVIPKIWTLEQGLSSISVEVTENGTFTSYGFSTKVIQPPSLTFVEQNLRNQKRAAFGNKIGLLSSVKAKTIRH